MIESIRQLDRILRGETTQLPKLREQSIDVRLGGLSLVLILLGSIYGLCMGSFAMFRDSMPGYQYEMQLLATTLKVPALFILTLLITFPSLYVFSALMGSRLKVLPVLRLLIASLAVNLAVLASLGPIVAFFGVCTTSYPFMVLLNVAVFSIAGFLGLGFLLQTLHRLSYVQQHADSAVASTPPTSDPATSDAAFTDDESLLPQDAEIVTAEAVPTASPLDRLERVSDRHANIVFRFWIIVFGLVGAQMGWVLRPFIGSPDKPFEWFREKDSNFFEAIVRSIESIARGG